MNTTLENELIAGMREQAKEWEPTRDVLSSAFIRHRRRQRNHRAATAVSMLAVASATVAAVVVIPAPTGGGHGNSSPGTAGATDPSEGGGEVTVDSVLSRAALAAAQVEQPRNDQFVYTLTVGEGMVTSDRPPYLSPEGRRQVRSWVSVDGQQESLIQSRPDVPDAPWTDDFRIPAENGTGGVGGKPLCEDTPTTTPTPMPGSSPDGGVGSCIDPALPTNADEMLDWLYVHGMAPWGIDPDANEDTYAWFAALDLMGENMSPSSREALYSALRRIPGVYLIPDTKDAAGRTTVAVARRSGETVYSLLFDPATGEYRGSLEVLVEDWRGETAGTVLNSTAVLDEGIVSSVGQIP
jgi:hypothetical protein